MSDHARYSPSGASRWLACPGSIAVHEPTSSKYADEGTAAHDFASRALTSGQDMVHLIGQTTVVNGTTYTCDAEMAGFLQLYLDYVRDEATGHKLFIEVQLPLSDVVGVPDQFGTGDALIARLQDRTLTVVDLKYGMGHKVSVLNNPQLMLYGLAALDHLEILGLAFDKVKLAIVQPRIDHLDEHVYTVKKLNEFRDRVRGIVRTCEIITGDKLSLAQLDAGGYLVPGDEQCRFCSVKGRCPALARKVSQEVYQSFEVIPAGQALIAPEPRVPVENPDLLANARMALSLVRGWCDAVESESLKFVMNGGQLPGSDGKPMKIVEGKGGHRYWEDETVAEGTLAAILPVEKVYKPREILSPAAVLTDMGEKRKKNRHPEIDRVLALVKKPPGKPTLALDSDPRQPYTAAASATDFDVVTEE